MNEFRLAQLHQHRKKKEGKKEKKKKKTSFTLFILALILHNADDGVITETRSSVILFRVIKVKADSQSSRSCGKWMRVPIQIH